jgi:hypothetical protein
MRLTRARRAEGVGSMVGVVVDEEGDGKEDGGNADRVGRGKQGRKEQEAERGNARDRSRGSGLRYDR